MTARFFSIIILVMMVVWVAGCSDDAANQASSLQDPTTTAQTGLLQVRLHDAPPDYYIHEVWVTIDQIEVHKAEYEKAQGVSEDLITNGSPTPKGEQAGKQIDVPTGEPSFGGKPTMEGKLTDKPTDNEVSKGKAKPDAPPTDTPASLQYSAQNDSNDSGNSPWIIITLSETEPIELTQYQDGLEALLANQELAVGKYTQIRLAITEVEVVYTEGSGTETQRAKAKLPSDKLKFTKPFDIIAGETTVLSFDFSVDDSIVITGAGEVIVKPVLTLDVSYEGGATTGPGETPTPENEPTDEPTPDESPTPEDEPTSEPTPDESPTPDDEPTDEPTPDDIPTPDNKPDFVPIPGKGDKTG